MGRTRWVVQAVTALSVLSLIAGFVFVTLIPLRPLVAQGIYLDEHAFLSHQAAPVPADLADVKGIDWALFDCLKGPSSSAHCVSALMSHRGLDVDSELTRKMGAGALAQAAQVVLGRWRSPRSDGQHSLALVVDVPTWGLGGPGGSSPSGFAVALATLRSVSSHYSLSKDVLIVVVANNAHEILQSMPTFSSSELIQKLAAARAAGVEALSQWVHSYVKGGVPKMNQAGTVLAALALDFPGPFPPAACSEELTMTTGSSLGLLPNLDVASATLSAFSSHTLISEPPIRPPHFAWSPLTARSARSPAPAPAANSILWRAWEAVWAAAGRERWTEHGQGTARFMSQQLWGASTAMHAPWVANGVDAVSVGVATAASPAAVERAAAQGSAPLSCGTRTLSRSLVAGVGEWLLTFSNLHEKLHHSTWLYLLSSVANFTTMASYVYAFALLAAPLALSTLVAVLSASGLRLAVAAAVALPAAIAIPIVMIAVPFAANFAGIWPSGILSMVMIALLAFFVIIASMWYARLATEAFSSHDQAWSANTSHQTRVPWSTVLSLLCGAWFVPLPPLAILNFSAALAASAVLGPLCLLLRPFSGRAPALFNLFISTLLSPPLLAFMFVLPMRSLAIDPAFAGSCLAPAVWATSPEAAVLDVMLCAASSAPNALRSPFGIVVLAFYLPMWVAAVIVALLSLFFPRQRSVEKKTD